MSFWMIALAVCVGFWGYDLTATVVKIAIRMLEDRHEERRIGFGDAETGTKKAKGATMRRIGFGAND